MDRQLRFSAVKRCVHFPFRRVSLFYDLIPNMPQQGMRLAPRTIQELQRQNPTFSGAFGTAWI